MNNTTYGTIIVRLFLHEDEVFDILEKNFEGTTIFTDLDYKEIDISKGKIITREEYEIFKKNKMDRLINVLVENLEV